jgi:hypothetical protein
MAWCAGAPVPMKPLLQKLHRMKHPVLCLLPAALAAAACMSLVASCAPRVDMPKGSHKAYRSARLIQRDPSARPITHPMEKQVHSMVQHSIARAFTSQGMEYGTGGAQLAVAYLVIAQEPGMTAEYDDYFGYGRNPQQIADVAHSRGALGSRPDHFRQGGIVIDVIETSTHKLVYRGFSKNDIVKGASDATRAARIDAVVREALSEFFQ